MNAGAIWPHRQVTGHRDRLRIAMLLPGLGRVQRGAEAAFLELAHQLGRYPDLDVQLFGTGSKVPPGVPLHELRCIPRERFEGWPRLPGLRSEYEYEELTFVLSLLSSRRFRPGDFDVTLSCSYPYVNWFLQRSKCRGRPALVFVTQNGDWMCRAHSREYRFFRCDGLVCTNPEYYTRHRERYRSVLIPNGVDPDVFHPAEETPEPSVFPLPKESAGRRIVLMTSALIPSKRVVEGIEAVARLPEAFLVVAGDGPQRAVVAEAAARHLPSRHALLGSVPREQMPALFRRAHAFLHMSRDEAFGLVYLEAASTGLPLVVHDSAVVRWVLGDGALFVDTQDRTAVADALEQALDPRLGRALGHQARGRVKAGWSWQVLAEKYRSFFHELTGVRCPEAVAVGGG
jgi:glycosyltransferase involved in cell wall biosynthesis